MIFLWQPDCKGHVNRESSLCCPYKERQGDHYFFFFFFSSCVCTRASTSLYRIGAVSFKMEQNTTLCPEQQQRPLSGRILKRCHSESKGQLRLDCDLRYIKFAVDWIQSFKTAAAAAAAAAAVQVPLRLMLLLCVFTKKLMRAVRNWFVQRS